MEYIDRLSNQLELSKHNDQRVVAFLSSKTRLRPEHVSLTLLTFLTLFIILTPWGNKVLMILLTFLYPSYKSFTALESAEESDDKKWLTYWVVFGVFTAFKDVLLFVFYFVPAVNLLLTVALFTLYCPLTNYYVHVYEFVFRPVLRAYRGNIQKYIDMAKEELGDKIKKTKGIVADELIK